jgi:hypothetical protein
VREGKKKLHLEGKISSLCEGLLFGYTSTWWGEGNRRRRRGMETVRENGGREGVCHCVPAGVYSVWFVSV